MNYKKLAVGTLIFALFAVSGLAATHVAQADNKIKDNNPFKQEKEARSLGSTYEVHITQNGNVLVRGAKITAISGSTITAATTWGSAAITWTINTDSSTKLLRRNGGQSTINEISVGDFISFQGSLITTSPNMTVIAKTIKDWSIQKRNSAIEGSVTSVSGTSFVVSTKNLGNVTVQTNSSTQYMKNSSTGTFADIAVNSRVNVSGLINTEARTIEASKVMVKIETPKAMIKEGKVKTLPGASAPTTFIMTSGGADYTVRIATNTSVLSNNWLVTSLLGFVTDHHVRVYGVVNSDNTIDATVVRNTNL